MQTRLERDGLCVVSNRAVKVALVVPGTGPIEITAAGLRVDRNQRIGVRDDTIVLAQFGQGITAIAVREFSAQPVSVPDSILAVQPAILCSCVMSFALQRSDGSCTALGISPPKWTRCLRNTSLSGSSTSEA